MHAAVDLVLTVLWFLIGLVITYVPLGFLLGPSFLALGCSFIVGAVVAVASARLRSARNRARGGQFPTR